MSEVYSSTSEPYGTEPSSSVATPENVPEPITPAVLNTAPPPPPPPPPGKDDDDDDEDPEEKGMLRMSFMEHLEELRARLLRAVIGVVAAFFLSILFCKPLWRVVSAPAVDALTHIGIKPPGWSPSHRWSSSTSSI